MLAPGRGGGGEVRGEEEASMGNKICVSRGRAVAERLTRPQRLLRQPSDVDYKKLRKLILAQKLAPCFDAVDDPQLAAGDLEECPICFLYYPSLNRSRCCAKGICTECFLQMKPSHASRPAQCPFCKNSCYAVQYHGARSEQEKSLEQAEEQKVIEAKIRMQSESPIEESLVPANQSQTLLELLHPFPDFEGPSSEEGEEGEIAQLQMSSQQETIDRDGSSYSNMCPTRPEEADVDLEEIMVMEAIWLSLQDSRSERSESSEMSSRSLKESHAGTRFPSCDQGESCSTAALTDDVASAIASLADQDILQHLELNWGTNQTDQRNSYENFVLESNNMQPEGGCSSGSGLSIA